VLKTAPFGPNGHCLVLEQGGPLGPEDDKPRCPSGTSWELPIGALVVLGPYMDIFICHLVQPLDYSHEVVQIVVVWLISGDANTLAIERFQSLPLLILVTPSMSVCSIENASETTTSSGT